MPSTPPPDFVPDPLSDPLPDLGGRDRPPLRLMVLRHAPAITGGRVAGRRDVAADCSDIAALDALRVRLDRLCEAGADVLVSPARRCRQTARALALADRACVHPALVEQDHGMYEGVRHDLVPDLGPLPVAALARHRPQGGESFLDMCARVQPILQALRRDTLIVAHAGTVRAALALVVGDAALSFAVAPLSLTILGRGAGIWAVQSVNLV